MSAAAEHTIAKPNDICRKRACLWIPQLRTLEWRRQGAVFVEEEAGTCGGKGRSCRWSVSRMVLHGC